MGFIWSLTWVIGKEKKFGLDWCYQVVHAAAKSRHSTPSWPFSQNYTVSKLSPTNIVLAPWKYSRKVLSDLLNVQPP